MLKRFQDWVRAKAGTDQALWALAITSFAESALLPLPVEAVSIPVMLANLRRVWLVAAVAAAASVAGGAVGYAIGAFMYETLGQWLISAYGLTEQFGRASAEFKQWGWTWVMIGGITPIPYKVISIASGLAGLPPAVFLAASALSRGIRFAAFALCFQIFGHRLQGLMDRYSGLISLAMVVLLLGGFGFMFWL